MKSDIMFKIYWVFLIKFNKPDQNIAKNKEISCLSVWNYKQIVLLVFGHIKISSAPNF